MVIEFDTGEEQTSSPTAFFDIIGALTMTKARAAILALQSVINLRAFTLSLVTAALVILPLVASADPLPSWNAGDTKSAIVDFVGRVIDPADPDYVTPADRIAVFDNDGTLWSEKPLYFQIVFAIDRVAELARADPDFANTDVLKAAAAHDMEVVLAAGTAGIIEILKASHAGLSVTEFDAIVRAWLATARHPKTGMAYNKMIYQPMLELLSYLRDEGFTTYIVSGGGQHFIRAFAEDAYGIPPNQVLGSQLNARYEIVDGKPVLIKLPEIAFIDDKGGKPVGIDRHIGKRPIFAGGNSDGDFAMLEWTTAGEGARFGLLVHHTDQEREWAYDREGHVGVLNRGLDEAEERGWILVDMKVDWGRVYPEGN